MTYYAFYMVVSILDAFQLVEAKPSPAGNIFGFAEYLASLALYLVIMTSSDFRYRYRLALTSNDLRKAGFWLALGIGAALLFIDWWFQNGYPIPRIFAEANNLKAVLALILLGFVAHLISVAVIRPPTFTKRNSKQFLDANYHFIHEGNSERLQVIAEELQRSLKPLIKIYSNAPSKNKKGVTQELSPEQRYAHDFFLLLGDHRFCSVVVDKVPTFAIACFQEAQLNPRQQLPIAAFVRNVGQEFIRNRNSSFYHEISGYDSGLIGYIRPVTKVIFGGYEFIETYAQNACSPLNMDYRDDFDGKQFEAYSRASLAFLESYLEGTSGRSRSQALMAVLREFKSATHGLYKINGIEEYHLDPSYERLNATVGFIKEAIQLIEKHAMRPVNYRISEIGHEDIYDLVAELVFETIFAASMVSSPSWTAHVIQNNTVFSKIFSISGDNTTKIIAYKVRRLIYDEIIGMNEFPNFKGARLLGYCLNVLGVKLTDRHKGYRKDFFPLQAAAIHWVRKNYRRLLDDHPKVALACIHGSVKYDAENHRLIKTYTRDTAKEAPQDFLDLD